jgi:hypothetical protein
LIRRFEHALDQGPQRAVGDAFIQVQRKLRTLKALISAMSIFGGVQAVALRSCFLGRVRPIINREKCRFSLKILGFFKIF